MNFDADSLQPVPSLIEKNKQPFDSPKGIYAEFSDGLDNPTFYSKCPNCGHVVGDFKSAHDAIENRYCHACQVTRMTKLKKQVAKAVRYENAGKLVVNLLEDGDDETDESPQAAYDRIKNSIVNRPGAWVSAATGALESATGFEFDDLDEDDIDDSTTRITLTSGWKEYLVFKTEEYAAAYATECVREDLKSDPSMFTQSWIEHCIDLDKLAEYCPPEHESWDDDEWIEWLLHNRRLEENEDGIYSDEDIENAKEQSVRDWPDAKETLQDIYGADWLTQVLKDCPGCLDVDKAAEDAVQTDGAAHFLAHYDGREIYLPNGAYAYRTN